MLADAMRQPPAELLKASSWVERHEPIVAVRNTVSTRNEHGHIAERWLQPNMLGILPDDLAPDSSPAGEIDTKNVVGRVAIDGAGIGGNPTFHTVGSHDVPATARQGSIVSPCNCITKDQLKHYTDGMKRRTYLVSTVAAVTGIAGCGGPGPGVNGTDGSPTEIGAGTDESPMESPTEGGTGTDTEAEAESPTETEPGSPTETGSPTESGTATTAPSVEMVGEAETYYFDPIGLAVEAGTTVEWTLESGEHSSTAYEDRIPEDAEAWDSGILDEEGATFSHTFDTEGTYDYYCTPHQSLGMVGRIVVGEPGGPAEEGMPPDGEVPDSQRIVEEGSVSYEAFTSE